MIQELNAMPLIVAGFPEHFVLTEFADGGVLLDFTTGSLYELNPVATRVCSALAAGKSLAEVVDDHAQTFGLAGSAAADDVRTVLSLLEAEPPEPLTRPFTILATAGGFRMVWRGETVLTMDRKGRKVTIVEGPARGALAPATYLQWVAPQLLALQGHPVLHASSVRRGEGVLAFSGTTGSGKTTTARTFAAAGAQLFSEDLLLLGVDNGTPVVFIEGEPAVRRWVAAQSTLVGPQGTVEVHAAGLADAAAGPTLALREILFLDRTRRSGKTIRGETLTGAGAFALVVQKGFIALEDRDAWRDLLAMSCAITAAVRIRRAAVPNGLAALQEAVRAYSATSTS